MFGLRKTYSCVCLRQISRRGYARETTKSHYESLGLKSNATQADIKKAYYKLSMKYHPDKQAGDDVKFREITAAYEVLGNAKLRRLYDQGAIRDLGRAPSAEDLAKAPPPPPPESSFYKSRVPTSGRTQIYNFDEWSRAHYAKARARDFEKRTRTAEYNAREATFRAQTKSETLLWFGMFIFMIMAFGSSITSNDYDKPSKRPSRPPKDGS